ncbi:antirestriction protein ArdC [Natronocella acetinitrilica]|uniref:Antirestriction protein ArdC n=1 Tax=Natronocella acetinitrilica TaxID=414046 RepID=A0AAE3G2H6_9GAMM|nr:zincin-like metallopeptidase domain-containing protein [Natronocella acetinitrilica]MCP1674581.1 antirestriction protein ArdC [Natronocella acetinitrilica]
MATRRSGSRRSGPPKQPYHERVAERVIEALEAGTAPWVKPWKAGAAPGLPVNAITGKPYRGMNQVWLGMMRPAEGDPRWCTYKQAESVGAQVRRGEKGTVIQFWKTHEERAEEGAEGGRIRVRLERPRVFTAVVFHASQIDNLPAYTPPGSVVPGWQRDAHADWLIKASGAAIDHDQGDRAFYAPLTDRIHMPPPGAFASRETYYATLFHELGHWTGHESRLNRDILHPFRSIPYAREELRAELASMMMAAELGLAHDPGNHHAYIASWIEMLRDDPHEIFRASRDAQAISDYIVSPKRALEAEQSVAYEGPAEVVRTEAVARTPVPVARSAREAEGPSF